MASFLLILSLSWMSLFLQNFTGEQILQEGLYLEGEERYEEALEVWSSAFTELDIPNLAIGREYIRLTTEQKLHNHYEKASTMYVWGLSTKMVEPNREALEQELSMLKPLAEQKIFREWERLLDDNNPAIYRELRLFWQSLNPTPATRYNERMLEHWERIAYARKHFDRRSDPTYDTDDRGIEYVRYGEPDRSASGVLTLHPGEVQTECASFPGCNPEIMRNVIMDLDPSPYYEIWIYDQPNPEMEYNLILIFGDKSSGGFQRVNVIEDFIPRRAFSLNDSRYAFQSPVLGNTSPGTLFTPGMIMQWLYYKQLISTDFFFVHQFTKLETEWDVGTSPAAIRRLGKFQGPMQEERVKMTTRQNMNRAPEEISTYENMLVSIPLGVFHYRLLDENNRPVAATFLESQPRRAFLEDYASNEDILFSSDTTTAEEAFTHYELTHGLLVTGENGDVLSRNKMPAELILDFQQDLPSSSVFTVPYVDDDQKLIFFAELHNRYPDSMPHFETPFPSDLRGLGKLEHVLPEPLSTDPDQLEMADLVLGWQMRADAPEGTLFPFVVANNREIPEGEELAIHLEIYNLQQDESGFASFTLDMR